MPVTAKLSKRFYEVLGEDVVNELVNWFNDLDATYRADLRELNERNFDRFDATLGQRLAESDAKWERRLPESDMKWERRLVEYDSRWTERWTALDARLEKGLAGLKTDLIAWMFGLWATTMLGMAALYLRG